MPTNRSSVLVLLPRQSAVGLGTPTAIDANIGVLCLEGAAPGPTITHLFLLPRPGPLYDMRA